MITPELHRVDSELSDDRHEDRHEHQDHRRSLEGDAEQDQQHVQHQKEDDRVVGDPGEPLAECPRHLLAREHLAHGYVGYWDDDGDGIPEGNDDDQINCTGFTTSGFQVK